MFDNVLYIYQRRNVSQTPIIAACSDDVCGVSGEAQVGFSLRYCTHEVSGPHFATLSTQLLNN